MTSIIRPSTSLCQQCRWHAFPTTHSLEYAVAQAIIKASQEAIQLRRCFNLVLAGGNTPRHVYELLKNISTDWHYWHIYFGDERCLPIHHPDRNSTMAESWLNHVNIPASQIHIIPAELGANVAALSYAQTLRKVDLFDLVILGLGEDGHTASLFPHHELGNTENSPATLPVHDAPKPPAERVSLSARRLSQTRQLVFLVTGLTKQQAIMDWKYGKDIPARTITPACGVDIFIEEALLNTSPCRNDQN